MKIVFNLIFVLALVIGVPILIFFSFLQSRNKPAKVFHATPTPVTRVSLLHQCLDNASDQLVVDREKMELQKANIAYAKTKEKCFATYPEE